MTARLHQKSWNWLMRNNKQVCLALSTLNGVLAYHSNVLVDGESSLIGSRFMKFRRYQLLHSKHYSIFTTNGYGSATQLHKGQGH